MYYKHFIDLNLIVQIKVFEGRELCISVVTIIFKSNFRISHTVSNLGIEGTLQSRHYYHLQETEASGG